MKKKLDDLIGWDKITALLTILSVLLAVYVSVISDNVMSGQNAIWNPFGTIAYIFQYGLPWSSFFMLFILFLFIFLGIRKNGFFIDGLKDERNFKYSESGIYGTAGFLKANELEGFALVTDAEDAYGTILGQMDKSGKHIINTDMTSFNNRHVAICGGSGAGKSRSYARPFIIQAVKRRESLVVTDPKGELYEDTVQYLRDHGYIVRILDLVNPRKSDSWNCLRELAGSDYRAQIFSSVVVENTSPEKDIWKDAKASLLKALCLRVERGADYGDQAGCKGPKTMESVYKLITAGSAYLEALFDECELENQGATAALQAYQIYAQNSPNSRSNIVSSLGNALQAFQGVDVCKMTEADDIDLTLPAQKPCAYFCIMSDQHRTMDFFASLFFSFLFIDLIEYIDENTVEKCVPVNLLLDEFPNIGSIPDFDRKIATVRSRNVNISLIFQGIPQLQAKYPEGKWSSIIGNCDTVLFLGTGYDQETAKFFSARTGEVTVKVKTEQHSAIDPLVSFGRRHSTGDGKRLLLNPDEILRLDRDRCIIVFRGEKVMQAYKYDYTLHPDAPKFKKCRIKDIPDIFDTDARQHLREEEEENVKTYEDYLKKNPPRTKNARKSPPANSSSMVKNIFLNLHMALKDFIDKRKWKVCATPLGFLETAEKHSTLLRDHYEAGSKPTAADSDVSDSSEVHFQQKEQGSHTNGVDFYIEDNVIYNKQTGQRIGIVYGNKIIFDTKQDPINEAGDDDDVLLVADEVTESFIDGNAANTGADQSDPQELCEETDNSFVPDYGCNAPDFADTNTAIDIPDIAVEVQGEIEQAQAMDAQETQEVELLDSAESDPPAQSNDAAVGLENYSIVSDVPQTGTKQVKASKKNSKMAHSDPTSKAQSQPKGYMLNDLCAALTGQAMIDKCMQEAATRAKGVKRNTNNK